MIVEEYYIYGPGPKEKVMAEVNKHYREGRIRTMMGHSTTIDRHGDLAFTVMAKRNPNNGRNMVG